jgi:hypothetical protein
MIVTTTMTSSSTGEVRSVVGTSVASSSPTGEVRP